MTQFVYVPSGFDNLTKYILTSSLYFKAFYLFRIMFIYFMRLLYVIVFRKRVAGIILLAADAFLLFTILIFLLIEV